MAETAGTWNRIYSVVRRVPRGRVATYGQVARIAGLPGQARLVGYALSALPERSTVPWHRVVNARGEISIRNAAGTPAFLQRQRLEAEGVVFDAAGRVPLARVGWRGRLPARRGR